MSKPTRSESIEFFVERYTAADTEEKLKLILDIFEPEMLNGNDRARIFLLNELECNLLKTQQRGMIADYEIALAAGTALARSANCSYILHEILQRQIETADDPTQYYDADWARLFGGSGKLLKNAYRIPYIFWSDMIKVAVLSRNDLAIAKRATLKKIAKLQNVRGRCTVPYHLNRNTGGRFANEWETYEDGYCDVDFGSTRDKALSILVTKKYLRFSQFTEKFPALLKQIWMKAGDRLKCVYLRPAKFNETVNKSSDVSDEAMENIHSKSNLSSPDRTNWSA